MFTLYYKQRSFRLYNHGSEKSMKRALIITTVSGFVPQFEMNNVKILQNLGYEVHYAANYHMPVYTDNNERLEGTGIIQHQIDFVRSPYKIGKNIKALNQLVSLMRETKFHLVHCHTPMGGVLGRIAAHKTNTKPVIYTAHGFHFYKGAPVWNWLFFYPVERFLAKWTDCLITINKEDYKRAKEFIVHTSSSLFYIPGIGIRVSAYKKRGFEKKKKRNSLNIPQDTFLLISIGELSKRKNHSTIIKALAKCENTNIHYIICGSGMLEKRLRNLVHKYQLDKRVHFLGYRTDIQELLACSDCFIFPSFQEGLPVALMEAMVEGLPVICSSVRGNLDLIVDGKNGYTCEPTDIMTFSKIIDYLSVNKFLNLKLGIESQKRILPFSEENVINKMKYIYEVVKNKNLEI